MVIKLPAGLFYELLTWARENHISTQQLALELLRDGLKQKKGWQCLHDVKDKKFSRKMKQWYCSNCYTFLDVKTKAKGGFDLIPRQASWEIEKTMTPEEWSQQIKGDNKDLK